MTFESQDPRLFFYEAVTKALGRLRLNVEQWTEFYLVELLARQIVQPVRDQPLVLQMEQAVHTSSVEEKFLRYREMGDSALFLVGFCEEAIDRRGVTRRYVVQMGGSAYRNAASLSYDGMSKVYFTLSDGFNDFAQVLDEVREMTSLRTPQDIVKLYEKWERTGSETAAKRLQEHGLFPGLADTEDN